MPELFPLLENSGALVKSSPGYDSSADLRGVVVDARDSSGGRIVLIGLRGASVSNDHHPYYELLFRGQSNRAELKFVRGQHFFYDVAGIEGMEWYAFWLLLTPCGIVLGFVIFTIERVCRVARLHAIEAAAH